MAELHELIARRLGITLEAAADDLSLISDPDTTGFTTRSSKPCSSGLPGEHSPQTAQEGRHENPHPHRRVTG